MNNLMTVAKRQFRSYFNGPIAYVVACIITLVVGFLFWKTFFLARKASVHDMFVRLSWVNYFAIPALTMGLIAEEKEKGSIELLVTMPVRDSSVIIGKFLGVFGLYAIIVGLTLPYPFTVAAFGPLDWGPVISGYIGVLAHGAAILALGLAISAWSPDQLFAFFISLFVSIALFLIALYLPTFPASIASLGEWLSLDYHATSLYRGVIAIGDLLYFASIVALSLMASFIALESRRFN